MGDHLQALLYHKKALVIWEKVLGKEHPDTATSYNNIADVYRAMGNYPQALSYHQKALAIWKKLGKGHPNMAKSYNNIARVYYDVGNYSQAYQNIKIAFDIYLDNREATFSGLNAQQKTHYLKSTESYISGLLGISTAYMLNLQKQGKQADFEQVALKTSSNWLAYKGSIIDSENRLLSFSRSSNNPKVKQHYQQLIDLKKRYAQLSQVTPEPKQKAQWQKQRQQVEQTMTRLQYEIAKQDLRFKQEKSPKKITTQTVSQLLKPNELYLDFAWVDDRYYIFTLTREGGSFKAFDSEDSKAINTLISSFGGNIQAMADHSGNIDQLKSQSRQAMTKLYDLLMTKELKNSLGNKTNLVISPDGALRLLPFEALFDKDAGQYLIEQKDIRYIASGKEFVRVSQLRNQQPKTQQAVIFANPNYGGSVQNNRGKGVDISAMAEGFKANRALPNNLFPAPPLAGTKLEAESIKRILTQPSPHDYQGNAASESNLLAVQSPKILHIATHGFFNADSIDPMLQSGLLLAGANISKVEHRDDGIVTALKLSGINLKGTDLVVLSACETGKVDPNNTEGISGLSKAFIQAGAKDVIMTLWKVDDTKTASLMESFYQKVNDNNGTYTNALKQSKLDMIDDDLHPYYWAGFVLNGL